MTIEGFRPCSPGVPFVVALAAAEPPCAMVPFTGDSVAPFAFCAGTEAPAGVGGACVAVVLAVECPGSCAGTAPESGVGVFAGAVDALVGCGVRLLDGAALVIRLERRGSRVVCAKGRSVGAGVVAGVSVSDRQAAADVKSGRQ